MLGTVGVQVGDNVSPKNRRRTLRAGRGVVGTIPAKLLSYAGDHRTCLAAILSVPAAHLTLHHLLHGKLPPVDFVFWTELALQNADVAPGLQLLIAVLTENMATWKESALPGDRSACTAHPDVVDGSEEVQGTPVEVFGKPEHSVRMNLWRHGEKWMEGPGARTDTEALLQKVIEA